MEIEIRLEEYEALKLVDYNHHSHLEASLKMGISRPAFTRIYDTVRKKIAHAFVEGLPIRVIGGYVDFGKEWFRRKGCHTVFSMKNKENMKCTVCGSEHVISMNESLKEWREYRSGSNRAKRIVELYICPSCKTKVRYDYRKPCNMNTCPECGKIMVRE